jgi:hypothetical protein
MNIIYFNLYTLLFLFNFINIHFVNAHGFMAGLVDCNTKEFLHFVRNYRSISFNIDSLRSPTQLNTCRNTQIEKSFNYSENQNVCVALAISNGAEHIGSCELKLNNQVIDNKSSCLSQLTKGNCGNANIPQLVTNDMCLYYYNNIPFSESGVLKWSWTAVHLGINNPEFYENCLDLNVNTENIPSKTSTLSTIQPTSTQPTSTQPTSTQPTSTQSKYRRIIIKVDKTNFICKEL